jgi:hypothetical protein
LHDLNAVDAPAPALPSIPRSAADKEAIRRLMRGFENRTVIPVIGAGVSHQAAGLPLWSKVLDEALDWSLAHCQDLGRREEDVEAVRNRVLVDRPTLECFETWARAMFCSGESTRHWEHHLYGAWLQEAFGGVRPIKDDSIYESLRVVDPRVVITTNYDELLTEQLFPEQPIVTWGNTDTIRSLLREGSGVFHLHGSSLEPESVILTTSDYQRIVDSDARSDVSPLLSSHSILLFLGISPAGATDRHMADLLKLGKRRPSDRARVGPAHVLLHPETLTAQQVARLRDHDIHPLSFGETQNLGPFLTDLVRGQAERKSAAAMFALAEYTGDTLRGSKWDPSDCLSRVSSDLRFMGWRSSKWVSPDAIDALRRRLVELDHRSSGPRVRFLIVNPRTDAYERLKDIRRGRADLSHVEPLRELNRFHDSFSVRCLSHLPPFRLTAVDNEEVGLALYPTSYSDNERTEAGWKATHYSLAVRRPWSLGRSMVFLFDELFQEATPLEDVLSA